MENLDKYLEFQIKNSLLTVLQEVDELEIALKTIIISDMCILKIHPYLDVLPAECNKKKERYYR